MNLGFGILPLDLEAEGEAEGGGGGEPGVEGPTEQRVGGDFAGAGKGGLLLTDASGRHWTTTDASPPKFSSPDALPPLLVQVRFSDPVFIYADVARPSIIVHD